MAVKRVKKQGKTGFMAIDTNKVFNYRAGDIQSRRRAKSLAEKSELEMARKKLLAKKRLG